MIGVGVEGGVFLDGRECARLAPWLRDAAERAEHAAGRSLPDVQAIVGAVARAALAYAAVRRSALADLGAELSYQRSPDRGTTWSRLDGVEASSVPSTEWITVTEAAMVMKIDASYVRRLARQGRLRARHDGQGTNWRIDRDDAASWTVQRERRGDGRQEQVAGGSAA